MPMTDVVNIHDAKTHFSRLVERASHGERITIARDGVPVAMLVALEPETRLKRPIGIDRGRIVIRDDFDDPLPEFDDHADDPIEPDDEPAREGAPGHPCLALGGGRHDRLSVRRAGPSSRTAARSCCSARRAH